MINGGGKLDFIGAGFLCFIQKRFYDLTLRSKDL
jgi:hypothetical protein